MNAREIVNRSPVSVSRAVRSITHTVRDDLFTFTVQPLPPIRRGRRRIITWFPHIAVVIFAVILLPVGIDDYRTGTAALRSLPTMAALAISIAQAVPLVVALYRPMAAWWMSLAAMVAAALMMFPSTMETTTDWPWRPSALMAQLGVLILVGLRIRPRVALELWVLTVGVGAVLVTIQQGGDIYGNQGMLQMGILAATALVITVAVQERSVALKQLAEQARLTSAERSQRALLEERARIARELHDVVAHHMSVIAIQAEAAPFRVQNPPEELAGSLATIRKNAVDALAELRRILGVLRADEFGTRPEGEEVAPQPTLELLDDLVDNVRAAGLSVDVAVTGARRPLPPGVELSAFRIIQEALSNALQHAPGAPVRVEVAHVLAGVGIRVVNAPSPNAPAGENRSGHGLMGMRERAAMLGGEMSAGPTSEGGYEVTAFFPLSEGHEQ